MALELQAGVNCPLWVLGTVAGPLGEQQGSSPLSHLSSHSAVCYKQQNPELSSFLLQYWGACLSQVGRNDVYT